jgi:hypothetical protein
VQLQLSIAETDEHRMEECCRLFPGDIQYKRIFYAQKATEKRARRAARAEKRRKKVF